MPRSDEGDRERSQTEAATWHAIAVATLAALACAVPVCVLLAKLGMVAHDDALLSRAADRTNFANCSVAPA